MTAIVWDQVGDKAFEGGADRGVLYFPDGGGVAWNGLISVTTSVKTTVEPVYVDGVLVSQALTVGDFVGVLKAYTYPDEFLEYEGLLEEELGVYLTGQGPKSFHLAYRTQIGNDIEGTEAAYKIHILWNLIAVPTDRVYETLSASPNAIEFEWDLTATPEVALNVRPTAYLIVDSRKITSGVLTNLEELLYGTASTSPTLPSLQTLLSDYLS